MKVIHFPTAVGGMSWELAQGERKLGLDSKVLYWKNNWLGYPCDFCIENSKSRTLNYLRRLKVACDISKTYDVFHLNYGSSLVDIPQLHLDYLDLPLYQRKKICVTYNGCDARQKYKRMCQTNISACKYSDCYDGICMSGKEDKKSERRIEKLENRHVVMFALNPDLLHFLPQNAIFLPYAINENRITKKEKYLLGKKLKVVHAPTQRALKGTEDVIKAVNNINKKYKGIVDFRLIEHVPHEQALNIYREADLVIDQLRVGWYGGLAMETMCMGIPTIAYINEADLCYIPQKMKEDCQKTIISANGSTLYSVLENIVNNPQILYEKHEQSMEYVHRWHNAEYVASITKKYYES